MFPVPRGDCFTSSATGGGESGSIVHISLLQCRVTTGADSFLPVTAGPIKGNRHFSLVDDREFGRFLSTKSLLFVSEGWSHCYMSFQSWLWSVLCTVRFMAVHWETVMPATQCSVLTLIILALQIHNPSIHKLNFFFFFSPGQLYFIHVIYNFLLLLFHTVKIFSFYRFKHLSWCGLFQKGCWDLMKGACQGKKEQNKTCLF